MRFLEEWAWRGDILDEEWAWRGSKYGAERDEGHSVKHIQHPDETLAMNV
jgi:hypothetical protein